MSTPTEQQKKILKSKTIDELRIIASRNFGNKDLLEYIETLIYRKDISQCIIHQVYELTDEL